MKLKHKLLEHPFYQMWTKGEITIEQLTSYAKSYQQIIDKIPSYWKNSVAGLGAENSLTEEIIADEIRHSELWKIFSEKLNQKTDSISMSDIDAALSSMNPSELLGAIYAFEIQQPEVALTKKEGLLKHYGFSEKDTVYFDEHFDESKHFIEGKKIADKFAVKEDFLRGFDKGAEIFYKALDRFLN